MSTPVFPPIDLAHRVGSLAGSSDPYSTYDLIGRNSKRDILALLPPGWSLSGKRVLDFGCGAGRTLRHFLAESGSGEFWGCDIDESSIRWATENLPSMHFLINDEDPPLDLEPRSFDLVFAISVFTHLVHSWPEWLLELRRIVRPDGFVIVTFIGHRAARWFTDDWDEDTIGMNVHQLGANWGEGGPMVFHSQWWLREHYGRAFHIRELQPGGFATDSAVGQGAMLLQPRPGHVVASDLLRPSDDPRELSAMRRNLIALDSEAKDLRYELQSVRQKLDVVHSSKSWRLTTPLRRARRALRISQ